MDRNHPQRSHSLGVMDVTPKALPPGRSLFGCCRPPDSPSTDDADRKHGNGDVGQMAQRIHDLSTEVVRVEAENIALRSELDDAKNAALRVQERLGSEIESLKVDLLRSKRDNRANSYEVEGLRRELETLRKSLDEATMSRERDVAQRDSILTERYSMHKDIIEFSAVKNSMQREIDSLCNMVEGIAAAKAEEVENLRKGLETESDENFAAKRSTRQGTESSWVEIAPTTAPEHSQMELKGIGSILFVSSTACDESSAENGAVPRRTDALRSNAAGISDVEAAEIGNLRLDLESVRKLLGRAEKNLDACRSQFDELFENTTPGFVRPTERSETKNQGMAEIGERLAVGKLGEGEEGEEEWECVNASTTQKARGNRIERSAKGDVTDVDKAVSTAIRAMREERSTAKFSAEKTTEKASDQAAARDPITAAAADATTEIANRGEARPKKKTKKLRPRLAPLTNSQFGQGELSDDEGLGYGDIVVSPRGIAQ